MENNHSINTTEWARIKSIVAEIIELPSGTENIQQAIEELCVDEPVIKQQVQELVACHSENLNQTLTPDTTALDIVVKKSDLNIGAKLSKYRIIEKIGQGGMGKVYLAQRNDEVQQKVAIKVIDLDVIDEQTRNRFEVERRVLAGFEHPNITRLIDAGTFENKAYYVMEYVDGILIDQYCEQNQLDLTERLKIFLKVCEAVSFAHRNLIVHRDLKPSNILVNQDGEVKLLDFGIAKPLVGVPGVEHLQKTSIENKALTPQYSSPEQINNEPITVMCDVYVLGLLLYRLLTGQHAFDFSEKKWSEIEKIISNQMPLLISKKLNERVATNDTAAITWVNKLKGDLEAIVNHSLKKNPVERYQSVNELSEDIQRYLNREPIQVKKDHKLYRFKTNLKRHWLSVSTIFFVIAVLLTSVVLVTKQKRVAIAEQQRSKILSETFMNAFKSADPTIYNVKELSAIEVIDRTSQLINEDNLKDDKLLAQLSLSISEVYRNLGERDKAYQLLKKNEAHYLELTHQEKVKYRNELIHAKFGMTDISNLLNESEMAIKELGASPLLLYTKAYMLRLLSRPAEAEKALSSYYFKLKKTDELYLRSCSLYGYVLLTNEKNSSAENMLNSCLAVVNSKLTQDGIWELSKIYFLMGRLYINMEQDKLAIKSFSQAIELRGRLTNLNKYELAEPHIFLSDALLNKGDYQQAFNHAKTAYDLRKQFSVDAAIKDDAFLTKPLFRIANYYQVTGDYHKAKAIYEKIISMRIATGSGEEFNTSVYYLRLGEVSCKLGLKDDAITAFEKAIRIFGRPIYNDNSKVLQSMYLIAQCHFDSGDINKAAKFVEKHWVNFSEHHKPGTRLYTKAYNLVNKLVQK